MKRHCERENRDYDEIEVTVLCPMKVADDGLTPEDVVDMCEELAEMGIHQVIFNMVNDHEITPIKVIGRGVVPQVKQF